MSQQMSINICRRRKGQGVPPFPLGLTASPLHPTFATWQGCMRDFSCNPIPGLFGHCEGINRNNGFHPSGGASEISVDPSSITTVTRVTNVVKCRLCIGYFGFWKRFAKNHGRDSERRSACCFQASRSCFTSFTWSRNIRVSTSSSAIRTLSAPSACVSTCASCAGTVCAPRAMHHSSNDFSSIFQWLRLFLKALISVA